MEISCLEELFFLENDGSRYNGIAFDGKRFYLTKQGQIDIFNEMMQKLCCVKTRKCFTSICYDPCFSCFWALAANDARYVYKLTCELREIDRIRMPALQGAPTGISCTEKPEELLLAAGDCVYRIAKSGAARPVEIKKLPGVMHLSVASGEKGLFCSGILRYASLIWYSTPYERTRTVMLPEDCQSVDMATGRCGREVYLLVTKDRCYYRIMKCSFDCRPCCEPCYNPCRPPCEPDYEPCMDSCCKPYGPFCPEPCCPPCDKHRHGHCEAELCDIIQSVALVETALSHILNAEGEKIQKILEVSNDPCEIMQVNKSVNATIANVTHLEYMLFEKMRLAEAMRDDRHKRSCES